MISLVLTVIIMLLSLYALIVLGHLDHNMTKFKKRDLVSHPSLLKDLPSVSVCLPARNEYGVMTECLEQLLASSYPKLEIIVIDDDSVDSTPQLIKAFAHSGVRFIAGGELPEGWLGKNYALGNLLKEANGTYVLFLDVDTKVQPETIGQLVSYARTYNADMISVLPRRRDVWRSSIFLAPLRYFWRVIFHTTARPIAASSAWMVERSRFLEDVGGFEAFKAIVEPETSIARIFSYKDSYRFLISDDILGLAYEKKLSSQYETNLRLRFPFFKFSIVLSVLFAAILALYGFLPIIGIVLGLVLMSKTLIWASVALLFLEVFIYHIYLKAIWPRRNISGAFFISVLLIEDAWISLQSMYKYKTHSVTWKGRPIAARVSDYNRQA